MVSGRTSFNQARCCGVRVEEWSARLSPFSSATTEFHTDTKSDPGPSANDRSPWFNAGYRNSNNSETVHIVIHRCVKSREGFDPAAYRHKTAMTQNPANRLADPVSRQKTNRFEARCQQPAHNHDPDRLCCEQCGLTCGSDLSTLEQSPKRRRHGSDRIPGPRRFERDLATGTATGDRMVSAGRRCQM